MLELKLHQPPEPKNQVVPDTQTLGNIAQHLEELQKSDRSLHNLIGMEIWAITKTMDDLYPGFWHKFMINSRQSMKQFIAESRKQKAEGRE
ncbi:hypothetical protein ACE1B6_23860 [Aerosakkonemataceae cyanobacterium BLCC-F154]|uniref:Uncharacterized protein n=1 Tax=Floridaenema fluviatile BLCC-F154 TaxID=3153640 RepID=A0ABV4YJC9_9CYAN